MCKLYATGHLTWVSYSEAVLLRWHVYFAGLLMKCKKKIYTHILSSFIEPCIQSQKENHHSQLIVQPRRKKTNHGNMDTRDLGRGSMQNFRQKI